MSPKAETVAARVEAVRQMTQPPKGRKARKGYASKADFAATLGVSIASVNRWTSGQGYPEEKHQVKLAALSRGRYRPEDFANDAQGKRGRPRALEAEVARMGPVLEALLDRVEALERLVHGGSQQEGSP